jgi:MFS transporter, UMF1 family
LLGTVFVRQEPGYLWLGLLCIAVGTVFSELAAAFSNSLLPLVSTRKTVGRVSAFGGAWVTSAASCCWSSTGVTTGCYQ